jgi:hypothetical protein
MPQRRTRKPQAAPKRAKTTSPDRLAASFQEEAPASPSASPERPSLLAGSPVKVTFHAYEPHAKRVTLAGEFNDWSPVAAPMQPRDDGHWSITLDLAPGRYQYKFVIDEHWLPYLNAHENVPNEHGTLNSVIEVHNPSQST